jgi:hypothetical protein
LSTTTKSIRIGTRFCGPPVSGNGGFCCGVVANALLDLAGTSQPAEVTLHAPPPLDADLGLSTDDEGVQLNHGNDRIASARLRPLVLETPAAPSVQEAMDATTRYAGFDKHLFPRCFVCGPDRPAGDGLRIFAGPLANRALVAAPWTPGPEFAGEAGLSAPEFLWAALDCPGYFGLLQPRLIALLGRMHGEILRRPVSGERCVVAGWKIGQEGRKHHAGTALYGARGDLIARASAIWIELDRSRFSAVQA